MTRLIILAISVVFILESCSSLKPLGLNNKQASQSASRSTSSGNKKVQFLNEISMTPQPDGATSKKSLSKEGTVRANNQRSFAFTNAKAEVENASPLQFKYSILLNTEVEQVQNLKMYSYIDEWYGTPYCMGGTTKSCIDCSAFVQIFFASLYGVTLPRTAREQHKQSKKISRTEMQEGDLLFYNTTGGVSHVGIYLQNNKFVHASSGGVTISDVFDPYWVKRFIDVGRPGGR